ncbi:Aste57867_21292 [Aphanomyces stellatus]|uniref:Aste57867_21292 protein n=1 Tax=Aphanomyces stellatus TaxID=120398 RepID=A0A485LIF0_9STRA|nr:hypothetical protein As57867_021223 [Aphanomyces stellatus]VFT97964.1 Aste57867_21292 [Aphanomyces stellatus]
MAACPHLLLLLALVLHVHATTAPSTTPHPTATTAIDCGNATGNATRTTDATRDSSVPLCDPTSCRVLISMGAGIVATVAALVVWRMYEKYTFHRDVEQFQARESELRSAVEEGITSSRSILSSRSLASLATGSVVV